MFFDLLPTELVRAIEIFDKQKIYELRLRVDMPAVINYSGKNIVIYKPNSDEKFVVSKEMIDFVIRNATENSLYAYNNQIKQGFITAKGGIRLGVAGENVVSDSFLPKTLKDICGINIRIPHEVKNCSQIAFKFIYNKNTGLKNTLILSPPGAGKTTFLRDIACQISRNCEQVYNMLIVDERFEIASVVDGKAMLDIGDFADIVSGGNKKFAFENGVRALRPDVILTDELVCEEDALACETAIMSGVKVIATVHATSMNDLRQKVAFKNMIASHCFERFVVISNRCGAGTYDGIFDDNGNCLYF